MADKEFLVYRQWYEHPVEIICQCNRKLYGKRIKTPRFTDTVFECGEDKTCGTRVIYRQLSPVAISESIGYTA